MCIRDRLIQGLTLNELLHQAYILVKKVGFTYSDIRGMTSIERFAFLKFYTDEIKAMKDSNENQ